MTQVTRFEKITALRPVPFLIVSLIIVVGTGCNLAFSAAQSASTPTPTVSPIVAVSPATTFPTAISPTATPIAASQATLSAAVASPAIPLAASDFGAAIRMVAQKVKPAVVQITNEQTQVDQFDQPFDIPAGVGSGVIYDKQGHILTNNHVVEGAQKLLVALTDGRSFQADLIGRDPMTDLAVVRISGTNLPMAELGDSNQLQVGDWVVAIGNALALDGGPTVTAGVVSALGRTVQEPSDTSAQGPYLSGCTAVDGMGTDCCGIRTADGGYGVELADQSDIRPGYSIPFAACSNDADMAQPEPTNGCTDDAGNHRARRGECRRTRAVAR